MNMEKEILGLTDLLSMKKVAILKLLVSPAYR